MQLRAFLRFQSFKLWVPELLFEVQMLFYQQAYIFYNQLFVFLFFVFEQ